MNELPQRQREHDKFLEDEWAQLLNALSLRHIFTAEELAEMTPIERQMLDAYLHSRRLSDWYRHPELQQDEGIEALFSERMSQWTRRIDKYLEMCAYESVRRYYYEFIVQMAAKMTREATNPARGLRRVDIEALKLLHEIFNDYEESLTESFERLNDIEWGSQIREAGVQNDAESFED